MFGLYQKKKQNKQTLASTILRLSLAFQLACSCAWSPSFAEANEAAKTGVEAAATINGAEKVEKIKIASVDSVIKEEKQEKKKSKLKPVELPKAEAKLIAVDDTKDAAADGKLVASKASEVTSEETSKAKRGWFGLGKTAEEKAFADAKWKEEEAKAKSAADAETKKWADEKAGKELAKKARAEAKAKAKAEKKAAKESGKKKDEQKDVKAEAAATGAAAAVNLPAAPVEAATPAAATTVPPVTGWDAEPARPEAKDLAPQAAAAKEAAKAPQVKAKVGPKEATEVAQKEATKAAPKDVAEVVPATPAVQAVPTTQAAPSTDIATQDASPDTTGDGKLVAAKSPVAAPTTPAEKQPAGIDNLNGEGIGGFVSAEDQKELSFLQEGRVEETIGDLNVIVIDNDEVVEMEETIAYEELPTDEGKTRIKTGAQFPVMLSSQISSESAKEGDIVQGRLKYDLKIGNKLVAKKGDLVRGRVSYRMKARSVMHSLVSPHRWYRNSGVLGLTFDEIITGKGEHIALNAKPARKGNIIKNKAEGRLLGVNHNGEITGPWAQQLRWKAVRVGLNFAMAPAGVFTFGAMPVALGVMGAVNPSFAFMKPVGTNVPHRRIKGFFWGALSGVPGSWIIEDTVTKGQPCILKPGDEFLVELQQEFTGEAVTSAQMLPGAGANVSSEVEGATKKNTVKGKKTKKK